MATVGVWPVVKSDYKPTDTVELGATYALGSVLGNAQRIKEVLTLLCHPPTCLLTLTPLQREVLNDICKMGLELGKGALERKLQGEDVCQDACLTFSLRVHRLSALCVLQIRVLFRYLVHFLG